METSTKYTLLSISYKNNCDMIALSILLERNSWNKSPQALFGDHLLY